MNLAHISSCLIFIITITTLTGEKLNNCNNPNNTFLSYYVIPVHYHIKLTHVYMETYESYWTKLVNLKKENDSFNFHGESSTTINILKSTQYIKLHELKLIKIHEEITLIKNNGITYALKNFIPISETNHLKFDFSSVLSPGLYTLKIGFFSSFTEISSKNFLKSFYTNKKNGIIWLLASHIQPNGVRQLFPCWDEPQLKATFTISVMHHYNFRILSNMPPRIHLSSDINDFIWTHIYTTPPMSTFQIALVITNYPRIYINENITLFCKECSKYDNKSLKFEFAKKVIEKITLHLQSEFSGINIPKMDHVALPNFPHDGTSKWGLIFHREADLIYDEQLDPVMHKIDVARLIAPKIAYQWFSNVFSLSHFWLHEGLATLYAEEAIVKIFQNAGIMDLFIVRNQYESLHLDSDFDMNPIQTNNLSETDLIFNFPRYMKVLIVLRMFQNAIGDERFRKNVQRYLYRHTFSSMISSELSSMQEILTNIIYSYDISSEFSNWMRYKYYPIVSWTQESRSFGKLSQNFSTTYYGIWWIPIRLVLKSVSNGGIPSWHLRTFFVPALSARKPSSNIFNGIPADWVMIDIPQAGYYRVNYNSENWRKIIYYLNSESGEYKNISVINRAKMIDDAFHLMMARQLDVSIFWELTKYLSQETDFVAWYPMIKVFEYMSTILPFPSTHYFRFAYIKEKFRKLLDEPLRTLGFKENLMDNDFTKCLRQEIVKWACTLDHPECLIADNHELYQYFQNHEKYPVPSEWKQWIYCKSLSEANESTWEELNVMFLRRQPDPKLLPFLACGIMERYKIATNLPRVLNQFTLHKKPDINMIRSQINTFFSIVVKFANHRSILFDLLSNLSSIKPEEVKPLTALTVIINNIHYFNLLKHINLKQMEIQSYINVELSVIQHKLLKRHTELKNHAKHFQVINIGN